MSRNENKQEITGTSVSIRLLVRTKKSGKCTEREIIEEKERKRKGMGVLVRDEVKKKYKYALK